MLDALKSDTDVLFYNVFGVIEIGESHIQVTANAVRAGRPHTRSIKEELPNPLSKFTAPFIVAFGAWLDNEDVHVAYGKMEAYNEEVFKTNILKIEKTIKNTVGMMKSMIE